MKNIFSFKLYREGLRRLTLTGSLFFALMMIGAVLLPILAIVQNMPPAEHICNSYCNDYSCWYSPIWHQPLEVYGILANLLMPIAIALFAPIATLVLFSFLNKRNSSDFFHSIPHKRSTIFVSMLASLVTWVWGAIIVTTTVSVGIFAIGQALGAITLHIGSILIVTAAALAGSLLMIAVFLIAMSVTGNLFSNITMALLIMYLPRAIFIAFTELVNMSIGYIADFVAIPIFSDWTYNIAFSGGFVLLDGGIIQSISSRHFYNNTGYLVGPIIYSFVLAAIYLIAGMLLFKRRKSEMAANPAPNRWVQLMNRVAVGFFAMLPAAILIILMLTDNIFADSTTIVATIAIYLVAAVVYFGYEFISKKQFTNFAKLLPGLALVLVLNFAFTAGAYASQHVILHRELNADNVRSVQVGNIRSATWDVPFTAGSYEAMNLQNFRFDDEALIEFLVRSLNLQLRRIRRGQLNRNYGNQITVMFHTNLGPVRRNLRISSETRRELCELFRANDDFVRIASEMPCPSRVTYITSMQGWHGDMYFFREPFRLNPPILDRAQLPQSDFRILYEVLREEIHEIGAFELSERLWDQETMHFMELWVHGNVGRQEFVSRYFITCQTPRAAAKALELVNAYNRDSIWDEWPTGGYFNIHHANMYMIVEGEVNRVRMDVADYWQYIRAAIEAQGNNPVDINETFFKIEGWDIRLHFAFLFNSDCEVILGFFTPATLR